MKVPPLSGIRPILANDWMKVASSAASDEVAGEGEIGAGARGDSVHGADDRLLERANGADDRRVLPLDDVAEIGADAVARAAPRRGPGRRRMRDRYL